MRGVQHRMLGVNPPACTGQTLPWRNSTAMAHTPTQLSKLLQKISMLYASIRTPGQQNVLRDLLLLISAQHHQMPREKPVLIPERTAQNLVQPTEEHDPTAHDMCPWKRHEDLSNLFIYVYVPMSHDTYKQCFIECYIWVATLCITFDIYCFYFYFTFPSMCNIAVCAWTIVVIKGS